MAINGVVEMSHRTCATCGISFVPSPKLETKLGPQKSCSRCLVARLLVGMFGQNTSTWPEGLQDLVGVETHTKKEDSVKRYSDGFVGLQYFGLRGETNGIETVVTGEPPQGVPEDDPAAHNCDAMGCGWEHVLERRPATKEEKEAYRMMNPEHVKEP